MAEKGPAVRALPLLLALALALLAGCATGGTGETEPGPTVEVRNQHRLDVTASVLGAGQRFSLGLVPAGGARTFRIPQMALAGEGRLAFVADPVGSREIYESGPVAVGPGERVEMVVRPKLDHSTVSVFRAREPPSPRR